MPTDETPITIGLHKCFCSSTGRDVQFNMRHHFVWLEWKSHGWTEGDIKTVAFHLRNLIRQGKRWDSAIRFERMIKDTDKFSEDLAEARSLARAPKPHPAHRELSATGRPTVPETPPARSVADILAAEQAFKQFRALKDTL